MKNSAAGISIHPLPKKNFLPSRLTAGQKVLFCINIYFYGLSTTIRGTIISCSVIPA